MAPDLVPHKHNMAKTRLAVIQDDILAAKHALANNLSFEGLEGDQLSSVLQTLLAQRAQEAATIPATATAVCSMAKGSPSPSSSSPCSSGGSGSGGGVSSSNAVSRIPVNGKSAPKKGKKRPSSSTAPPASKSSKRPQTTPVNASPPSSSSSVAKTPAAAKTPAPAKTPKTEQQRRRQSSSGKAAKKARSPGPHDRMRQLRKSIKIGDTVSVLMDVNIDGIWEKEWVEGEVIREMNRSGIFQIAFDHDRYGNKSEVKQEPSATQGEEEEEEDDDDTERWIHEQRLQIDHPDFFCGQGDNPPVGIDNCRPRGAWFLHRSPPVQRQQGQEQEQAQAQGQGQEQEQPALDPASPPAACSRTPHNLSNGGGGQGSSTTTSSSARSSSGGDSSSSSSSGSSSSTSSSPALPQSHVVCGPVSLGNDGGDLGGGSGSGSSVAAAAQANANATDSVGEERDAGGLMGVGLPYAFA